MTSRRHAATDRAIKARRDLAMSRPELRQASSPREFPAGPTSAPIKTADPETRRLVDDAIRARRQPK